MIDELASETIITYGWEKCKGFIEKLANDYNLTQNKLL